MRNVLTLAVSVEGRVGMKVGVVAGGRILNHFAPEQVPNGDSLTTAPPPPKSGPKEAALLTLRSWKESAWASYSR